MFLYNVFIYFFHGYCLSISTATYEYNKLVQISYMLFNRITDSLSALLFVLQELTLTQKDINPITVKTINNGAYCFIQCELFYKCHSIRLTIKGRNIAHQYAQHISHAF
jgi:hypothetical protein